MPLTAKDTTAASAAISMNVGSRWRTSAMTAAMAKTTPMRLVQSELRADDDRPGEEGISGRKRTCRSNAATPMAATTTRATGLKNARWLVYRTTSARAASSRPAAMMVAPRGRASGLGLEESSGTRSRSQIYTAGEDFFQMVMPQPDSSRRQSGAERFALASHSAGNGSPFLTA